MGTGIFGTGLSGLAAHQRALATTGHNIANVNTDGYTRQRTELIARPGQAFANGFIGSGVEASSVQRLIDNFTTMQIRTSTAAYGELDTFHRLAGQVDNMLADPDGGLTPALQDFFGAVHELAADPASVPSRQVLMGEAKGLAERFHILDRRLADLGAGVEQEIKDIVGEVNALTSNIAKMNAQIVTAEGRAQGQPANDLRDQRDQMIKDLSERVALSTVAQDDGSINVFFNSGQALIVGQSPIKLGVTGNVYDSARGEIAVNVAGTTSTITSQVGGGELAGVLDFRDQILEEARRSLGRTAIALAESFNTQHRLGMDLSGAAGADFFDPLGGGSPVVRSSSGNSGVPAAVVDAEILDIGALTTSEYRLERSGALYSLTRLSDGTSTTLSGFPADPVTVDGVRLSLGSGTIADGDSFLIQPTVQGARAIDAALTSPDRIAAAAPVRAEASLGNSGNARISAPVVNSPNNTLIYTFTGGATFDVADASSGATLAAGVAYVAGGPIAFNGVTVDITGAPVAGDVFRSANAVTSADAGNAGTGLISEAAVTGIDPNLTDQVTITFTGANTFDVTGATTGAPTVGLSYTQGAPISFNGWTLHIEGDPLAGDTFVVEANTGGVGDNRNALALAALQTTGQLDAGTATYEESYGQLITGVGTATRQAEINLAAQGALLNQAVQAREAESGVNLDEEAANLMRYQQGYEASAQVIAVADEIFRSLLDAVGR